MLYKNQRLAFEAGWWGVDDVDETDAPPLLSNSAGVYPIYFTDGPMQAVVYDFSESRLYTLTTIVSVLVGCFVLMCFMLSYNSGIMVRTFLNSLFVSGIAFIQNYYSRFSLDEILQVGISARNRYSGIDDLCDRIDKRKR